MQNAPSDRPGILISCPNLSNGSVFLPHIYGVLKTYAEQDPLLKEAYKWLKPIYLVDSPTQLLSGHDPTQIQILGLSGYAWNWKLQIAIAEHVKAVNPDCWVIVGGPHARPEDPDFFAQHPYFDVIVKQEGEEAFAEILRRRLVSQNISDLEGVPGVVFRGQQALVAPVRFKPELHIASPWQAQSVQYREMMFDIRSKQKELGVQSICAVLESNRGCPYHCTFCDWGGLTYSKMSHFSDARVRQDIDWLTEAKVDFLFLSDSNWGMFDRDVELSRYLAETAKKTGYPKGLYYSPTKSSAKNLKTIAEIFFAAKIEFSATLSIQHTDKEVLAAVARKNLKDTELESLATEFSRMGVPVWIQLILGCPGDTYEKWTQCLYDLLERRIDGNLTAFAFSVLPNAPAAQPEYRLKWGIQTTTSRASSFSGRKNRFASAEAENEVITACNTFSQADWIEMWVAYHMINATHSSGLTKFTSEVLSHQQILGKGQFYRHLLTVLVQKPGSLLYECATEVRRGIESYLNGGDHAYDEHPVPPYRDMRYFLKYDQWIHFRCVMQRERFYEELIDSFSPILTEQSAPLISRETLGDLVQFQKNLIADATYEPHQGRFFSSQVDWLGLHPLVGSKIETLKGSEPLCKEAAGEPRFSYRIGQTHLGVHQSIPIGWAGLTGEQRNRIWLFETVKTSFARRGLNTFMLDSIEKNPDVRTA